MWENSIYDNHKAQRPLDTFFKKEGQMDYTWRGKSYNINKENFGYLPPELQQSFTGYCAKNYGGAPKPKPVAILKQSRAEQNEEDERGGSTFIPSRTFSQEVKRIMETRQQLIRIATNTIFVEEKLNYPKVFQALISQPHTILDQLRKTEETYLNLTVFVDELVGYHESHQWFHNTIIKAAEGLKGVNVYSTKGFSTGQTWKGGKLAKSSGYSYFTDLLKDLPKEQQKKILIFTQGCGGIDNPYSIVKDLIPRMTFCTWFHHGDNCGCNQIATAEKHKLSMKYSIREPKDLREIE